ncbi:MAG: YkgJ family cysteine cluster protein [Methanoregula sp.]|nr:YkgJ family cysteine cluster protein [Methanoregula sp.]
MDSSCGVPIPYRIIALMQERNRLFAYPMEHLAGEIKATGFRCNCCGTCCSRTVNGHIFLLDHDVAEVKKIDPAAFEPAPDPEFCDQNGTMYVSGYALRMKNDMTGSCWFLEDGRCRIYDQRFSVCRTYPHMLRRNCDESGEVTWRQFARLNEHGRYEKNLPEEECILVAREVKEYENAFFTHQISFLETIHEYFTVHTLRHDQKMYDDQMRRFLHGGRIKIMVYHAGELKEHRITKEESSGCDPCRYGAPNRR